MYRPSTFLHFLYLEILLRAPMVLENHSSIWKSLKWLQAGFTARKLTVKCSQTFDNYKIHVKFIKFYLLQKVQKILRKSLRSFWVFCWIKGGIPVYRKKYSKNPHKRTSGVWEIRLKLGRQSIIYIRTKLRLTNTKCSYIQKMSASYVKKAFYTCHCTQRIFLQELLSSFVLPFILFKVGKLYPPFPM